MLKLDRLLKLLWLANGFIFLVVAFFYLAPKIHHILRERQDRRPPSSKGLVVGEEHQQAKEKQLELQGLRVRLPIATTQLGYLLIPISQVDYSIP